MLEVLARGSDPPVSANGFPPALPIVRGGGLAGIETQVQLGGGAGILDMRIDLQAGEIWIEAKTGSPEGGAAGNSLAELISSRAVISTTEIVEARRQLDIYRDRAEQLSLQDGRPRAIVLLSPTRLGRYDVPWLAWASVRQTVRSGQAASRSWHDLVQFLEDSNVTDDQTDPIRSSEAASLSAVAGLYRKAANVIWDVHEQEIRKEPQRGLLPWKSKAFLINAISPQLAGARFMAFHGPGPLAALQWGIADHDGEAWWIVAISDKKVGGNATTKFKELWDRDPRLSMAGWAWHDATLDILVKTIRVVTTGEHEQAVAWFHAAFKELEETGVIAALAKRPPTVLATPVS